MALSVTPVPDTYDGTIADILECGDHSLKIHREYLVSIETRDHTFDTPFDEEESILIHAPKVT